MNQVLDQLNYFAFLQCVFLVFIYTLSKEKRDGANVYLLILIGILALGLTGKIVQSLALMPSYRRWYSISEFAILFFGPTVYLFTVSSLSEKRFEAKDLFHYLPGVIYSLVVTFYYLLPSQEIVNERWYSGELIRVVRILVATGLAVNITYFVKSIIAFRKYKNDIQQEVSYAINLRFIRNFLLLVGLCFTVWLIVYLLCFMTVENLEINVRPFIWIVLCLLVLFISYYQIASPHVFDFKKFKQNDKYVLSKFNHAQLDELKLQLEQLMTDKKPFLNAKLLKADLAREMGLQSPDLARLLNEKIGMNFFEFVNYYRIHEFIRLAKTEKVEKMTLLGIAQEAGFNSKATFNKSFKQLMGCSPSAYLKK